MSADDKAKQKPEVGLGELSSLRRILVGPLEEELEEVGELARRGVQPKDVSKVLPEAVLLRQRKDERLSQALAPTMERALVQSVKRNPKTLADALFPVMGPAIRRSIQHTLTSMLDGMNQTFTHGLSPKGFAWRLEAWRTGRSFAEVVLLKSLVYRVEQALLIHRQTGLLLEHAAHVGVVSADPELVSAMLSALQSFVGDSFARGDRPAIQQVEFGEGLLQVASGPHALLAVLVRGTAPPELRTKLEETIERVHAEHWSELEEFEGDPSPFFATREKLEACLGERRIGQEDEPRERGGMTPAHWFLTAVGLVLLVLGGFWWRGKRRWDAGLRALEDSPGIIVLHARHGIFGRRVEGLRDPNAADPGQLLASAGIDPQDCTLRFHPTRSLEPELIVAHARELLEPPAGVALELHPGGRLSVLGEVDDAWLERARLVLLAVDGVRTVERASNEEIQDR